MSQVVVYADDRNVGIVALGRGGGVVDAGLAGDRFVAGGSFAAWPLTVWPANLRSLSSVATKGFVFFS